MPLKVFHKLQMEGNFTFFYYANNSMIPKPDKDAIKQKIIEQYYL